MADLHIKPLFGLPYAPAGVEGGRATATCPVCGHVSYGRVSKSANRAYAEHFEAAAEADRSTTTKEQ